MKQHLPLIFSAILLILFAGALLYQSLFFVYPDTIWQQASSFLRQAIGLAAP